MSDELKRLYADEWKAAHPYPSKRDVDASERFLQALQALESQNQALQERAEKAEAYLLVIADGTWNEAHVREVEGRADNIHVEQFARAALSPTQETDPG